MSVAQGCRERFDAARCVRYELMTIRMASGCASMCKAGPVVMWVIAPVSTGRFPLAIMRANRWHSPSRRKCFDPAAVYGGCSQPDEALNPMDHLSLFFNSLFMALAMSAPYLVLGYVAAALIKEYVSRESTGNTLGRSGCSAHLERRRNRGAIADLFVWRHPAWGRRSPCRCRSGHGAVPS